MEAHEVAVHQADSDTHSMYEITISGENSYRNASANWKTNVIVIKNCRQGTEINRTQTAKSGVNVVGYLNQQKISILLKLLTNSIMIKVYVE